MHKRERERLEARVCMGSVKLYGDAAVHPVGKDPLGTDCEVCHEAFGEPEQELVEAWARRQKKRST